MHTVSIINLKKNKDNNSIFFSLCSSIQNVNEKPGKYEGKNNFWAVHFNMAFRNFNFTKFSTENR